MTYKLRKWICVDERQGGSNMSQLFGMDFSSLVNRTEQTNGRKVDKTESKKNIIGK